MIKKIADVLQTFKRCINMSFKGIWDIIAFTVKFISIIISELLPFIVAITLVISFCCISIHIKNDNIAKAIVEKDLQAQNYEWIFAVNGDYNSAELLARKRADDKYGIGKHTFVSTNFNSKVWYKTNMK